MRRTPTPRTNLLAENLAPPRGLLVRETPWRNARWASILVRLASVRACVMRCCAVAKQKRRV
eukprot:11220749-Lingulodinium_polyedra.AAC.1